MTLSIENSLERAWSEGAQSCEVFAVEGSSQEAALEALGFSLHASHSFSVMFACADKKMLSSIKKDTVWMTMGDFDLG